MHFTKPAWVMHKDSAKNDASSKRLSIFSVHVHPDGSRIATGGLDAKIRIWSTKPILNPDAEASGKPPKSLCTLTMHTGPVLTVRWAHNGRWLASGSDDEIVMIWDLDPHGGGKVWGSDEVNVEGWKPLKRLVGHESDVTDVAWAPQDRYLASVGLDSKIIIWDGYTLERVHKLEQHQGFVKGVCWDPVGEFLATQSDDRSVKIWRTADWEVEATVTKPFEDSPGSTFFRRLSWSPDGAHITASNATNNNGFVFIAAVITRNVWTSEISLVGHENTIEVASYNPHIFLRKPDQPVSASNICSVVALGADDRSVSVWQTKSARPLIVAKQVFDRQIMDLSWSSDGLTLYAASSDGTIAVFHFTPEELEGIAPQSIQDQYLAKFEFALPPPPPGSAHVGVSQPTPPPSPGATVEAQVPKVNIGGEQVNQLVARRGKTKKRVALVPSSATPGGSNQANGSGSAPMSKRAPLSQAFGSSSDGFGSPFGQPFEDRRSWNRQGGDAMDVDYERKRPTALVDLTDGADTQPAGRTLGGDKTLESPPIARPLASWGPDVGSSNRAAQPIAETLAAPTLLSHVRSQVEESDHSLSVANDEKDGIVEVCYTDGQKVHWVDYLESPVLLCKATKVFSALACQDGSIVTYTPVGRRLLPTISLGSPVAFLDALKNFLLVVTASGMVHCWDVRQKKALFQPTTVVPLISSPNDKVTSATLSEGGKPIIKFSNDTFYSYDSDLLTFFKLTERWWAEHSDYWLNLPGVAPPFHNGPLAQMEKQVKVPSSSSTGTKPRWWSPAITLGHLESKMMSALRMESSSEFKAATLAYARKLAEEGFQSKADELLKEIYGPLSWHPFRDGEKAPSSTICGLDRRGLAKEIVSLFARSNTLVDLATEWQRFLRKADDQVY